MMTNENMFMNLCSPILTQNYTNLCKHKHHTKSCILDFVTNTCYFKIIRLDHSAFKRKEHRNT